MKIIFVSNYFNHHQKAFCDEMFRYNKDDFVFIATTKVSKSRLQLGYGMQVVPAYVKYSYTSEIDNQECSNLINNADVVIIGSAPYKMIKKRVKDKKLIFRYSERPLKNGLELLKYAFRFIKWHMQNPINSSIYILCASAYTAADYSKFGLYRNKMYKWGYFPKTKKYLNIETIICEKKKNELLWCGRFLDWKHPDDLIKAAQLLREDGYSFHISFIGCGELDEELQLLVHELKLDKYISFLGSKHHELVRQYMEQASIYLFTSDNQEGWGAVLNESMNSACAVIASHAIGSVPFLIRNFENGLIYKSGDVNQIYKYVKDLFDHPKEQERMGMAAYKTIVNEWNAEVAAERFIVLAQKILEGEKYPEIYKSGPCSKAEILNDGWYQKER